MVVMDDCLERIAELFLIMEYDYRRNTSLAIFRYYYDYQAQDPWFYLH